MYLIFYGCGLYAIFYDKEKALEFCNNVGVNWTDSKEKGWDL